MSSICPKCGATADKGPVLNQVCLCGGVPEEIDDGILKALLPFAPKEEGVPKWLGAALGIGGLLMYALARRK